MAPPKKTDKRPVAKATATAAPPPSAPGPRRRRTREQSQNALIRKVKIFYDLQRLRMQIAGRTYERADGTVIELHEHDIMILEHRARELETAEKHALADIQEHLETIPFYVDVLSDRDRFRGIGPTMAGVILSAFDIAREETVSQMWSFAGLAPIPANRCKKCHAVVGADAMHPKTPTTKCPYSGQTVPASALYASGKAQRPTRGEKLKYNAFLRTKLVGVLGPVLLKCDSPWRDFYDDYKHRKQSQKWGQSDAHRHNASIRYMIKMLLNEIHKEWRVYEGLPLRPSYQEEYLEHTHQGGKARPNGGNGGDRRNQQAPQRAREDSRRNQQAPAPRRGQQDHHIGEGEDAREVAAEMAQLQLVD